MIFWGNVLCTERTLHALLVLAPTKLAWSLRFVWLGFLSAFFQNWKSVLDWLKVQTFIGPFSPYYIQNMLYSEKILSKGSESPTLYMNISTVWSLPVKSEFGLLEREPSPFQTVTAVAGTRGTDTLLLVVSSKLVVIYLLSRKYGINVQQSQKWQQTILKTTEHIYNLFILITK